jgi:hypothetical protein
MNSNLPTPNTHLEVLYRQTFNTLGGITAAGLTQDNRVGNVQKTGNTRLTANTNKGILAGSVVAVVGNGLIGPCAGDSTQNFDAAVGIAVNDAVGNPFESSSAVASQKVVYAHGTGSVIRTDIYETVATDGTTPVDYNPGDALYASQNGLLTNASGLGNAVSAMNTLVGILLTEPTAADLYMTVQLRV